MQDLRKPRSKMVSERGREIREERRKALYTITCTSRTINFNVSKRNGRTEEADRGREKETTNRQRCG